jgi:hypothetical protein
MAISIITNPGQSIDAFSNPYIEVSSSNLSVERFLLEVLSPGDVVELRQYNTAYAGGVKIPLRSLSSLLSGYNNPLEGVLPAAGAAVSKPIDEFVKRWSLRITGISSEGTTVAGESITVGPINIYKSVYSGRNSYWNNTKAFIALNHQNSVSTRSCLPNALIPLNVYRDGGVTPLLVNGVSKISLSYGDVDIASALYRISSDDYHVISIDSPGGSNTLNISVDYRCYPRSKTLYFLNTYGGWEWYNTIDWERTERSSKDQYTRYADSTGRVAIWTSVDESIEEYTLYGRPGVGPDLVYLRDLIRSPIVLDENGTRIRVLDTNTLSDVQGILEPEITIQYLRENTITF